MIKLSLQLLFNNSVKYSDVNSQTTMAQISPLYFFWKLNLKRYSFPSRRLAPDAGSILSVSRLVQRC